MLCFTRETPRTLCVPTPRQLGLQPHTPSAFQHYQLHLTHCSENFPLVVEKCNHWNHLKHCRITVQLLKWMCFRGQESLTRPDLSKPFRIDCLWPWWKLCSNFHCNPFCGSWDFLISQWILPFIFFKCISKRWDLRQ